MHKKEVFQLNYTDVYLCQNIKNLRLEHGYSLSYTAKALHISVRTLNSIEKGVLPKYANPDIAANAAKLFQVDERSLYLAHTNTYLIMN